MNALSCCWSGEDSRDGKAVLVGCLLVMCAIVELGQPSARSTIRIDQDAFEHIVMCIRMLSDPLAHRVVGTQYRSLCRSSFHALVDVRAPPPPASCGVCRL